MLTFSARPFSHRFSSLRSSSLSVLRAPSSSHIPVFLLSEHLHLLASLFPTNLLHLIPVFLLSEHLHLLTSLFSTDFPHLPVFLALRAPSSPCIIGQVPPGHCRDYMHMASKCVFYFFSIEYRSREGSFRLLKLHLTSYISRNM